MGLLKELKIGQEEVLELLEKEKKPLGRSQIAEILQIDACVASKIIKHLLNHNEIKCIEIDRIKAQKIFKDKTICRRLRLYYV